MTKPSYEDFLKQFDRAHERVRDRARDRNNERVAMALAAMAALDAEDFVKFQIRSWDTLGQEALHALVSGLVEHPDDATPIVVHTLVRMSIRCAALAKLFEMMLHDNNNIAEPSEEEVKELSATLINRIKEEQEKLRND